MVVKDYEVEGIPVSVYYDNFLNKGLTKIGKSVNVEDEDRVLVIDGPEGCGKSVFGFQVAKHLDPNFNIDNVCFTPENFHNAITRASKGSCIVYDEAFTGLSARSALAEVNRMLVSLMMEMRQKNLFVIVIMPTIFLLDKYVALWRARGLFHLYRKKGKRGYWMYFNNQKKKLLYIYGKREYNYSRPKTKRRGKFYNKYTINEKAYRLLKAQALRNKSKITRKENFKDQRNILFYIIHKIYDIPQHDIALNCKKCGYRVSRNRISEICNSVLEKVKKDKENDNND